MRKLNKFDTIKLISLAGMALGGLASLVTGYAQEKAMAKVIDETVEEKVNKALALKESGEESK